MFVSEENEEHKKIESSKANDIPQKKVFFYNQKTYVEMFTLRQGLVSFPFVDLIILDFVRRRRR